MEMISEYIKPELLIVIPVLNLIGMGVKRSRIILSRKIPVVLGLVGIALALIYILSNAQIAGTRAILAAVFTSITQGILCAGCSVYLHQLVVQHKRKA